MRERRVRRRLKNKYHIPSLQGDNTRKNNRGTVLRYCSEKKLIQWPKKCYSGHRRKEKKKEIVAAKNVAAAK